MQKRKTLRKNRPDQRFLTGEWVTAPKYNWENLDFIHVDALRAIAAGDASRLATYLRCAVEGQPVDQTAGIMPPYVVAPSVAKVIAFMLDGRGKNIWGAGWRLEFKPKKRNPAARELEKMEIGFYVRRLMDEGKPHKQAIEDARKKFGNGQKMARKKVDEAYAHLLKMLRR